MNHRNTRLLRPGLAFVGALISLALVAAGPAHAVPAPAHTQMALVESDGGPGTAAVEISRPEPPARASGPRTGDTVGLFDLYTVPIRWWKLQRGGHGKPSSCVGPDRYQPRRLHDVTR